MVETSKMDWADPSRSHVKDMAEKKKGIKVGLYFPSHSCNDLKRALKEGVITKKTFLIIVEDDRVLSERKRNLKSIRSFLTRNKLTNVHIHSSRVHTLNLKKVLTGRKIDLLFFDICGNYTAEIANWFNKNQEHFACSMLLPMTIAIHPRGPKNSGLFAAIEKTAVKSLRELGLDNVPNDILASENINCLNLLPDIRLTLKAIYYSFSRKNVKFVNIKPYKFSKTNMVNFEVIVMKTKEKEDEMFEAICLEHDKRACPANKLRPVRKIRKKYTHKPVTLNTAYDIARHMGIFGTVDTVEDLSRAKQSWITINSKRAGLDPVKVRAKIEKKLQKEGLKAA